MVSILTTWVWTGGPFTVPSAMSKAGLNIMTQSLAVEWGPKDIRFNAIAPGPFPTEGAWARLNPGDARDSSSAPGNPMGRVGKMPELANLAVFLLAPARSTSMARPSPSTAPPTKPAAAASPACATGPTSSGRPPAPPSAGPTNRTAPSARSDRAAEPAGQLCQNNTRV